MKTRSDIAVSGDAIRVLELAFPPVNFSPEQMVKFNEFVKKAKNMGIEVIVHFME